MKGFNIEYQENNLVKKGTAIILMHPEDYKSYLSQMKKLGKKPTPPKNNTGTHV